MRFLNQKLDKGFGSFMLSSSFFSSFNFIFGCTRSWLLYTGFLQLQQVGTALQGWCAGFSLQWLRVAWHGLQGQQASEVAAHGPSGCGTWPQQLWCTGLVAARHVEPSQTRDGTSVRSSGGQIHEAVLQYLWETEDRQTPQSLSYIANGLSCFLSKKDFSLSWSGSCTESVTYTKASQKKNL